ncbi:MAG TPA: carbamate kinase [Firmicutes bacterium]|nr:carbamate kinase [Bacillota bacterium]
MNKKLVIALGGNALGNTSEEQLQLVKKAAKNIVDLIEEGYTVIVGHGNGPQVGMINSAMEYAATHGATKTPMPFPECGAMSQGYIGYHLEQSIKQELDDRNIDKEVACIVTEVIINKDDPAFVHPTKPIGLFYNKTEADQIAQEKGYHFIEDSGRGYRRVVPSPEPQEIVELEAIKQLVEHEDVVITVGGGGIPVIQTDDGLQGIDAVIDKDKSSAKLAQDIHAKMLIILTAVEQVFIHYNQPNQKALTSITVDEAKRYIQEGHFAPGSMLPKVEACIQFVENTPDGTAIITSLEKAKEALQGKTGTYIHA